MDFLIISTIVAIAINISLLFIRFKIIYNTSNNIGTVKIYLFGFIKIIEIKLSVFAFYFNIVKKDNSVKQINIDINDKTFALINELQKILLKKIYLVNLHLFNYNYNEDCVSAVYKYGSFNLISFAFLEYIKNKNYDAKIKYKNNIDFINKENLIKLDFTIMITLFDLIWSIVFAFLEWRLKYGKKQSK